MGYQRGDDRYGGGNRYGGGDDRWRERGQRPSERGGYDRDRERPRDDDDRGFFERAGEQVRSWFGDEDDNRGGGNRERGGYYGSDYNRSNDRYAQGDAGQGSSHGGEGSGGGAADTWSGSGFGGNYAQGRRFDRVDAGSTGTHGAHPMSSASGGVYGAGAGVSAGGYGSSARSAAIMSGGRGNTGGSVHDQHYSEWRNRQIEQLDRDYDEYRREHQSKFEQEFHGWREKRQGQRSSMGKVTEHMQVFGSDGQPIGTVDKVRGDRIMLAKNDEQVGGHQYSIPCSWIESVDDRVTVNKTAAEAMKAWKDEENSRALFEREDQGSDGPHVLNRSFSGTYDDKR